MKRLAGVAALMSATMLTVAAISPSLAGEDGGTPTRTATVRVVAQQDASAPNPAPNPAPNLAPNLAPMHFSPGMKDPREGQRQRGPARRMHGPGVPGLQIAGKLSAAQTYVGITPDQENAWQTYSNAVIDFFERPADGPPAGPEERAGKPQQIGPDAPRPFLAERIAGFAIERGEKGKALKDAFDTLKSVLGADQLDRLAKAEQAFASGPHGPGGRSPGHGLGPREGFSPPSGE